MCYSGIMELFIDDVGMEDGRLFSRGEYCSIKIGLGQILEFWIVDLFFQFRDFQNFVLLYV